MQKQLDLELELFGDLKENKGPGGGGPGSQGNNAQQSGVPGSGLPVGKVYMLSLSSQPVDHEDPAGRAKVRLFQSSHKTDAIKMCIARVLHNVAFS